MVAPFAHGKAARRVADPTGVAVAAHGCLSTDVAAGMVALLHRRPAERAAARATGVVHAANCLAELVSHRLQLRPYGLWGRLPAHKAIPHGLLQQAHSGKGVCTHGQHERVGAVRRTNDEAKGLVEPGSGWQLVTCVAGRCTASCSLERRPASSTLACCLISPLVNRRFNLGERTRGLALAVVLVVLLVILVLLVVTRAATAATIVAVSLHFALDA
mmetsp:Transcript_3973/g.12918  ORF Transcript_3973/g.12918 Transcript_3973/m.12918 type:complete len:216 (-) Transcript_3973:1846-2493(-)